jgi:hypothetical protein
MRFNINNALLTQAYTVLSKRKDFYWILGGAGSGKTTISQALSSKFDIPIYNMDDHIYGTYHSRFIAEKHPVNMAWSKSENGLAWLLDMQWNDFNNFNQAVIPEYLSLLCDDTAMMAPNARLLIDGGICNPSILVQAFPASQIVCLACPGEASTEIWGESGERTGMKEMILQLPNPQEAWLRFLEFDEKITQTILQECQENNIPVFSRTSTETVDTLAAKVANTLGLR